MRASRLPLAAKCRKSATLTTYGSEPATLGTAFHEMARDKVLGVQTDFESIKSRYGISKQDLDGLLAALYNIQINIPKDAIVFSDDEHLESKELDTTGTPDLVIIKERFGTVIDWKSGWNDVEDPEINLQLIDYAIMVAEKYPEVETFDLILVLPRQNTIKAVRLSREDLLKRAEDIKTIVQECKDPESEYTVGSHCQNCFGCMTCPAFAGEVERFAGLAVHKDLDVFAGNVRESLSLLLPFAKAFNIVAGKIEAVAKAYVDTNGSLDLGGAHYIKVLETRDKIDPEKAMPILELFFEGDVHDLLSISKTALKNKAQAKGRGEYKKIYDQLVDKKAIEKKPQIVYRIKKGAIKNEQAKVNGITKDGADSTNGSATGEAHGPHAISVAPGGATGSPRDDS